jgi:hypothetical protein
MKYDTGSLLMDKRMKDTFERHTLTGPGCCGDCTTKKDDGYIACVECDADKSNAEIDGSQETMKHEDAFRTGQITWVRESAWLNMFNVPVPPNNVCFIDEEAAKLLQGKHDEALSRERGLN